MEDVRRLSVGEGDEERVGLDELAREGARRMIAAALEAEVDEYVGGSLTGRPSHQGQSPSRQRLRSTQGVRGGQCHPVERESSAVSHHRVTVVGQRGQTGPTFTAW